MFSQDTISQMLQNGELKGLVIDNEFGYIPLRLTGTGLRERLDVEEKARIVNRDLTIFSTPALMQIYANLPLVLDHPKNENGEAVRAGYDNGIFVGNTISSFIKDDEIWVIARLQDKDLIEYLKGNNDLSTSPHFITEEVLENGIFQEIPIKINSLAIVSKGFWDATSKIPAIDNSEINIIKESIMEKEKADSIMEQEVSKADKADGTTEEKVADLEKNEAKEAKAFEELAKDHKELEKGDSVEEKKEEKVDAEVDKRELIREEMAVASKPAEDFKGGKEEKVREIAKLAEEEAYNKSEADKNDSEEEEEIKEEFLTDDDREAEKIIKVIHEVADSEVKVPVFGKKRLHPTIIIKKFAQANRDLVESKYSPLLDKIDSSMGELANEIFVGMQKKISSNAEARKQQSYASGMRNADGNLVGRIFGSKRFENKF